MTYNMLSALTLKLGTSALIFHLGLCTLLAYICCSLFSLTFHFANAFILIFCFFLFGCIIFIRILEVRGKTSCAHNIYNLEILRMYKINVTVLNCLRFSKKIRS